MSFKAKDLQFDNSQPAFLRRLRGEMTGEDAARHERPIHRNKRMKQDDEDDAPTYVLEDTNQSLTKAEYEALVSGKDSKETDEPTQGENEKGESNEDATKAKTKDKIAEVGKTTKKRKAAKVIGEEEGDGKDQAEETANVGQKVPKKTKKKAKTVKLSFGDEEE